MCRWNDYSRGDMTRDFIIIIAVCLFALLVANLASQFVVQMYGDGWPPAVRLRAATFIMQLTGMFAPAILLDKVLRRDGGDRLIYNLNTMPSLRGVVLALSLAAIAVPVIMLLSGLNAALMPSDGWLHEYAIGQDEALNSYYALVLVGASPLGWAANVFLIVVVAAVCEELLFRGVFLGFLLRCGLPRVIAVLIVSIMFVCIHSQVSAFLPRLVMGIFLGYAYLSFRNIWAVIIIHAAYNLLALCDYVLDLPLWLFMLFGGVCSVIAIRTIINKRLK